jgi:A/G-specific adenine glycosylase
MRFEKTQELPVKSRAKKTPHYDIGVGIIRDGGKLLIGKRRENQMLGGLWEFPGGKKKDGESIEETVVRECKEETGLDVRVIAKRGTVKHAYTHFKITLSAFDCEILRGPPKALSAEELRWIDADDLESYPFPTANKKILELLK